MPSFWAFVLGVSGALGEISNETGSTTVPPLSDFRCDLLSIFTHSRSGACDS